MGEYATYAGQEIKIGTCEDMFNLRLEDRAKVGTLPNSLDPAAVDGLWFRLPFPDEDDRQPGNYEGHRRGQRLYRMVKDALDKEWREDWTDPDTLNDDTPGMMQLSHPSGLMVSVVCHHGLQLPAAGGDFTRAGWNGKTHAFELIAVKPLAGELFGIVNCRHCRRAWRYPLADLLPWVPDTKLRERLAAYLGTPA